ncbi:DUF2797 domain-containing protein [Cardinium endosymbiont of Culicoides punctatus]|uniref:DUF2797 domain-containing protein n=1 Tax=Cardinium endosymbiont of Culicoides punctatus TaxID=2304601 RepID=UPI001059191F
MKLDSSYINCYKCYEEIGFHPRFLRKKSDSIPNKQSVYNEKEHYVYLAYFGKSNIKVGTAYCDRLNDRLTEQGARAALLIKKCINVYEASKLEQFIHHEFKVQDKVLTKKNIDNKIFI